MFVLPAAILGPDSRSKEGWDVNRHTIFGSPYLLGFEHLERLLERTAQRSGDSYPPYNIEASENGHIRITLAVAGFAKEELSVTEEDHQLVVRGMKAEEDSKTFLQTTDCRDRLGSGLSAPGARLLSSVNLVILMDNGGLVKMCGEHGGQRWPPRPLVATLVQRRVIRLVPAQRSVATSVLRVREWKSSQPRPKKM